MTKTFHLKIRSMACSECCTIIHNALAAKGVININICKPDVIVTVPESTTKDDVLTCLRAIGHSDVCITEKLNDSTAAVATKLSQPMLSSLLKSVFGISSGLVLLTLPLIGIVLPFSSLLIVAIASTLFTGYLGIDTYITALHDFFINKKFTMDSLFVISTVIALSISFAAFFISGLPMLFNTPLLIFGFKQLGIAIKESMRFKLMKELDFQHKAPRRVASPSNESRAINELSIGDTYQMTQGTLPVDSCCAQPVSLYDTLITGHTAPKTIAANSPLQAGMEVIAQPDNKPYSFTVLKVVENSYLATQDQAITNAYAQKTPIEETTAKVSRYFIASIVAFATIAGICISYFFSPLQAILTVTTLLVAACPCILGFVIPLTWQIGTLKLAQHGAQMQVVQTPASDLRRTAKNTLHTQTKLYESAATQVFESAATIDTVVFDLNGTLTTQTIQDDEITVQFDEKFDGKTILNLYLALEKDAKHVFAKAICRYAQAHIAEPITQTLTNHCTMRTGVSAFIGDTCYRVGNQTFMSANNINTDHYRRIVPDSHQRVYLACDDKVIACCNLPQALHPHAQDVIQKLHQMKKKVYICTGADQETALVYAKKLGVAPENVKAGYVASKLPNNNALTKPAFIADLKKQGCKVAMVGDAANDEEAFVTADLSMAIRSAGNQDEPTRANIIIANTSLQPIIATLDIAKQTLQAVKLNLVISLACNVLSVVIVSSLIFCLGIVVHPGLCMALMVIQTSLVLFNTYRFKQQYSNQAQEKITDNTVFKQTTGSNPPQVIALSPKFMPQAQPRINTAVTFTGSLHRDYKPSDVIPSLLKLDRSAFKAFN